MRYDSRPDARAKRSAQRPAHAGSGFPAAAAGVWFLRGAIESPIANWMIDGCIASPCWGSACSACTPDGRCGRRRRGGSAWCLRAPPRRPRRADAYRSGSRTPSAHEHYAAELEALPVPRATGRRGRVLSFALGPRRPGMSTRMFETFVAVCVGSTVVAALGLREEAPIFLVCWRADGRDSRRFVDLRSSNSCSAPATCRRWRSTRIRSTSAIPCGST